MKNKVRVIMITLVKPRGKKASIKATLACGHTVDRYCPVSPPLRSTGCEYCQRGGDNVTTDTAERNISYGVEGE